MEKTVNNIKSKWTKKKKKDRLSNKALCDMVTTGHM